jgi:hypothetical protein
MSRQAGSKDEAKLHQFTFGITSDPLTQLACAFFAALVHDADHPGVPNSNSQMILEKSELAEIYKNRRVAEQHSCDISWDILMEPAYKDLRACIYSNQAEIDRFRQVFVHAVLATDIMDKETWSQETRRRMRWDKAFTGSSQRRRCHDD